jgi:hypothetical protein
LKNRLNLDWTLSTATERSAFLQQYMEEDIFAKRPPTEEELETMANYLLWGQDEDGLNPDQRKEIQLPRKNATWASQNIESLDELLESPTFSENSIYEFGAAAPKKVREVFSREELRTKLSPAQLQPFEDLWDEIDRIEIIINFFELEKGKRTKPPRNELLGRFSKEEIETLEARSQKLTQFRYLKLRHLLVELRRQQYTLRDSVLPRILGSTDAPAPSTFEKNENNFDIDVPVFPLGIQEKLIFRDFEELVPGTFKEEELKIISDLYWEKKDEEKRVQRESKPYFDFRDLEMVYQLFLDLEEFAADQEGEDDFLKTGSKLLDALWFYVRQADLPLIQRKILDLKIKKVKNQDIATIVNQEFGKSYTTNYISTIFRQKIIPTINEAAIYHEKIIGSIFFEEDFKVCSKCGRLLLRDSINFVRRTRAKDGLSNHCKKCDKEEREKKKGGIIRLDGDRN